MKKKKIALVIGGNGGVGIEITNQLLKDKFHVCATYNIKKEKLNKLKKSNKYSDSLSIHHLNFSNEKKSRSNFLRILKKYKKIDVIVFAISKEIQNKRIFEIPWNELKEHLDLQLKSLYLSSLTLEDQIKSGYKTKFLVILTEYCLSSPPKGLSHYVTAKYAAMGLAKSISQEISEYGSTCNMISPGMIETDLLKKLPRKLIELNSSKNPMKRNCDTKDISHLVSFLASEKSDYLNGANIVVNGGNILF